jgi:hypothetical protein
MRQGRVTGKEFAMRFCTFLLAAGLIALFILFDVGAAHDKKVVKPVQRWANKINDNDAKKFLPRNGVIIDGKNFEELWKAWRKDEKVPGVDFTRQIVLVHTASGPNVPLANYSLDGDGNLRANTKSTLLSGPGFGYSIEVLSKEGVKMYQGKKIE